MAESDTSSFEHAASASTTSSREFAAASSTATLAAGPGAFLLGGLIAALAFWLIYRAYPIAAPIPTELVAKFAEMTAETAREVQRLDIINIAYGYSVLGGVLYAILGCVEGIMRKSVWRSIAGLIAGGLLGACFG